MTTTKQKESILMIRRIAGFTTALVLSALMFAPMIWAADSAQAATTTFTFEGDDFLIPRPEAQAPIGDLRLAGSFDVVGAGLSDFIGSTCTFVVSAANGDSVHIANRGLLTTNGSSSDVLRTEDQPNVNRTVLEDPTLRLGETVQLYNIIGVWTVGDTTREGFVGTSVNYVVTGTCSTVDETTTPTTTVEETTTTTGVITTTSTVPETTTTTQPGDTTSTTAPGTTSTTGGSTTSTVPPITGSTLPFTGPFDDLDLDGANAAGVAMAGAALLLLGGGVLLATKQ